MLKAVDVIWNVQYESRLTAVGLKRTPSGRGRYVAEVCCHQLEVGILEIQYALKRLDT